ncbi:MAG: hypothetical protein M0Z99_27645 [Betaproteobacteria bacterium]|nr:hypothetical protein [Betaproteobacteria bacterium]
MAKTRLCCVCFSRRRHVPRQPASQFGIERRKMLFSRTDDLLQRMLIMLCDVTPDQLQPRPIRRRTGFFRAAPQEREHIAPSGMSGNLLRCAGLANSRLPGEQNNIGLPGDGTLQRSLQCVEFTLPSDEPASGLRVHRSNT